MHPLSDKPRSDSNSNSSSTSESFESTNQLIKDQITKANAVPIISVLGFYKIKIDLQTKKISCPFSDLHSGGIDKTPSFYIYPETNSFFCYGCKVGGGCVNLVSIIDNISKINAAQKILSACGSEVDFDFLYNHNVDHIETLKILMDFSNYIRDNIASNEHNEKYMTFIDEICCALDVLHEKYKHKMSNESIRVLVDRLKNKVENYK